MSDLLNQVLHTYWIWDVTIRVHVLRKDSCLKEKKKEKKKLQRLTSCLFFWLNNLIDLGSVYFLDWSGNPEEWEWEYVVYLYWNESME